MTGTASGPATKLAGPRVQLERFAPTKLTIPQRAELGTAARARVPVDAHAQFGPSDERPDPVAVLQRQAGTRVADLVPIRYGRMLVSPFAFFRGAAAVMAADLATTPVSGLRVQLCGDAHLANFGLFGSPERRLLFDINDFDETYPGPWEWDVKRLAASFVIVGRENGLTTKQRRKVVRALVRRYHAAMAHFATMRELEVWHARADAETVRGVLSRPLTATQAKRFSKSADQARTRDSLQAYRKLVAHTNGQRRIIAAPPLIVPIADLMPGAERHSLEATIRGLLYGYRDTLPSDRRFLLDRFTFVDMARKVVGVGSVGTRCWIVLLEGRDEDDPLFLQVKEAQRSVLADYVHTAGLATYRNEGERVVAGQRLMQAASDIFLGWQSVDGLDGQRRDFYVRQLRDWKRAPAPETMTPADLAVFGEACAWTLARAHARSGDRIAVAAYLGEGEGFVEAIAEFAERYADQNETDYAALNDAACTGRVPVKAGL